MINNDVAIIMYYWNHYKRKSLLNNFYICHNNLSKYNAVIIPIEISTNGSFDLPFPGTIKFQTDQLLWQKERVINYVCQKLTDDIKYVSFIDGDILFSEEDWIEQTKQKLDNKENLFIQPFSSVHYLPRNHTKYNGFYTFKHDSISRQVVVSGGKEGYKKTLFSEDFVYGNPGIAWITKKETLLNNPLYDKCIVGGGDTINIIKWLDLEETKSIPFIKYKKFKNNFIDDLLTLPKNNIDIDYIDQPVFHLNHGNKINRQYASRFDLLDNNNFSLQKDLAIEQGIYRYVGNSNLLKDINKFFNDRNEDLE
jgi:hypothetical protein